MKWNVKKRRKVENILSLFFLFAFVVFIFYNYYLSNRLESNYLVGNGKVESLFTAKGIYGFSVRYSYLVNGKVYDGSTLIDVDKNERVRRRLTNLLIDKTLQIVYSPTNAGYSEMLLERSDYLRFNIVVPDSLNEFVTNVDNITRNN